MHRPTHATTTATTTHVSTMLERMIQIKEFQVIEFQYFFFDNILILLIFLIIKSLKSRKYWVRVFESPLLCIWKFECSVHIFIGPCSA